MHLGHDVAVARADHLGEDATVADARAYVRGALSTNSRATLGYAKDHAENQR